MYEIFDYIENNEDYQFTLSELKKVVTTDFIPDSKTIISKLIEHYNITRDSRINRDNEDVKKIIEWLTMYNPFPCTNKIMSLANGITGNYEINCYDAYNVGIVTMNSMVGLTFENFKFKRANRVLPLLSVKSSIKVHILFNSNRSSTTVSKD